MRIILMMVVALVPALPACGDDDGGTASGDGVTVVASFYPLAEVARQVGGDRVTVDNLTPVGAEPHDLELRPDQVDRLEDADLVVVLGGDFQPGIEEVAARRSGSTVVALDELDVDAPPIAEAQGDEAGRDDEHGNDDEHEGEDGHDHGAVDPHIWLDPTRMAELVDVVAGAFADLDPAHAEEYRAAAASYRDAVLALDAEMEAALASCERRTVVVSHAAFGWLVARYDLRQEAVAGLSPEQEPDPRRLGRLIDLVRDEGVTTVFTETLVSPKVGETLAREAGVETAVLNPLEGLTRAEVEAGADYLSVMRDNLAALERALGCG